MPTYNFPTRANGQTIDASHINAVADAVEELGPLVDAALADGGGGGGGGLSLFNVKDYGATGNGSTDDYSAIMGAITAADNAGTGATVYFPPGLYRHNQTLNVPGQVRLLGGYGGGSSYTGFYTALLWGGGNGGTQIQRDASSSFVHGNSIEKLMIRADGPSGRASVGIAVDGRLDMTSFFEHLHLVDHDIMIDHYTPFVTAGSGGINQHYRKLRIDRPRDVGIRWRGGATDNVFFDAVTFDSDNAPQAHGTTMGGFMEVDYAHDPSGAGFHLTVINSKFEVRTDLHPDQGLFTLHRAPMTTAQVKNDWYLTFINCLVTPYIGTPSATRYTAVKMDPPTDGVMIRMDNCTKWGIEGVPSAAMTRMGSDGYAVFDVISPYSPGTSENTGANIPNSSNEMSSPRIVGGLNRVGGVNMQDNRREPKRMVGTITATDYSAANGGAVTFRVNDTVEEAISSAGQTTKVIHTCTDAGTLGDPAILSALRVSTTSGSPVVTVTAGDINVLRRDMKINLGGQKWIADITSTTQFRMLTNAGSTASNQTVSFWSPTFQSRTERITGTEAD